MTFDQYLYVLLAWISRYLANPATAGPMPTWAPPTALSEAEKCRLFVEDMKRAIAETKGEV
jgi:hypothetical protein